MSYPTDNLPRFKATDVNVLDRGNCHRIVATWEIVGGPGEEPRSHPRARLYARRLADALNHADATGGDIQAASVSDRNPKVKTHGVMAGYWAGCHCRECLAANRDYDHGKKLSKGVA